MRLKTILSSMAVIGMMGAMSSCTNEESVKNPADNQPFDGETISLSINFPDSELRTRAGQAPVLSYGADGLFSFNRTIDRLDYAVYNKGNLVYHSKQAGMPQATYDATSQSFALDIQIPKINGEIKLADYSVFFFAGNASDKFETSEITDGVGVDFANKTLYCYPTMLNKTTAQGDMYMPVQYDFFAKYITMDQVAPTGTQGNIVLTRPFAQVSVLTDELCQPSIISAYASNGKVSVASKPSVTTTMGVTDSKTLPYAWNYGTDKILTKPASSLNLTLNATAFNNVDGSHSIPQVVTFKERTMFCAASYLMLAPNTKQAYDAAASAQKFTFDLNVAGDLNSTDASISADIPAAGIRANEKYVMYNKAYDPGTGEGGSGGILSTHYAIDIVVDPTWADTNDLSF